MFYSSVNMPDKNKNINLKIKMLESAYNSFIMQNVVNFNKNDLKDAIQFIKNKYIDDNYAGLSQVNDLKYKLKSSKKAITKSANKYKPTKISQSNDIIINVTQIDDNHYSNDKNDMETA